MYSLVTLIKKHANIKYYYNASITKNKLYKTKLV